MIDIHTIKQSVGIMQLLDYYGCDLSNASGSRYVQVFCPFHDNTRTPAGSMDIVSDRFKCFSCGVSGDVIDIVMQVEGLESVSDAITFLRDTFLLEEGQDWDV